MGWAMQNCLWVYADSIPILRINMVWENMWAGPCKNVSLGICRQRRPRSACTSVQSDQGLHCPQTESLDTKKCFSGEQMSR